MWYNDTNKKYHKEVYFMARRQHYGENMARWEAEQDERYWKCSFQNALDCQDYRRLEELIKEGICENYSFPHTDDPVALELLDKYLA